MAKPRPISRKKNGIVTLKFVVKKLQKISFSVLSRKPASVLDEVEEISESSSVPEDVKEGHFAVIAQDDHGQPKRLVVALSYLKHPAFIRLLELAAEEFGFVQEGALTIPCRSTELERILAADDAEN
ncbi:hypothetical protein NE237_008407 [Protea cynaroides]|uniref:Uncharacterized protein n=1 Tax=Protea cynaroides TaxID=273540 RepID=A0A9Q0KVT4_9MAGN|nr:hypothetical protein NE237_008407 [Protea cynaroides]